jgi:hypothetical protein
MFCSLDKLALLTVLDFGYERCLGPGFLLLASRPIFRFLLSRMTDINR